eukprot:1138591-Pelagomonas_calceolata.AAC.3
MPFAPRPPAAVIAAASTSGWISSTCSPPRTPKLSSSFCRGSCGVGAGSAAESTCQPAFWANT